MFLLLYAVFVARLLNSVYYHFYWQFFVLFGFCSFSSATSYAVLAIHPRAASFIYCSPESSSFQFLLIGRQDWGHASLIEMASMTFYEFVFCSESNLWAMLLFFLDGALHRIECTSFGASRQFRLMPRAHCGSCASLSCQIFPRIFGF